MDNKMIENWQEYSKSAMASAKELEAINTRVVEQLTAKQMEIANAMFETSTRYVSTVTEVKGYQELLAEQTRITTDFNETMIDAARATADILNESRDAYQAWMEKSFQAASAGAEFKIPGLTPAKKTAKKAA